MLHLQKLVRGALNVLADLVPVSRAIKKSSQDQHVQRALEKVRAFRLLFPHGRHSTVN
jgi:predicted aminopeptidase